MVWCVFNRVCPFYKSERSLKEGANLYYNFQVSDVIPYYTDTKINMARTVS
jgi:hypothetical protein